MLNILKLWTPIRDLKQVLFSLDISIYRFIGDIYDFLMGLAQMRIFTDADFNNFATRMYALVGIIMLFKVTIILISIVVNPAGAFHEKEGTAIPATSKVIVTIVLVLVVPVVFNLAYEIQSVVLRENVIGKLITGVVGNFDDGDDVYVKGQKCTYEMKPDRYIVYTYRNGFTSHYTEYIVSGPIVYDLALPASSQYAELVNLSDNNKKVRFPFRKVLNQDYENGISKCREFAHVTIAASTGGDFRLDIKLFDTEKINFWGDKANFHLIHWENSEEGSYKLTAGRGFGAQLLKNFIVFDEEDGDRQSDFNEAVDRGDFDKMEATALDGIADKKKEVKYYIALSTIAGLGLILLLISSCFDISLRAIKLGFLQLTAPIPIATYIETGNNKGSVFNKWLSVCLTTYFDIFIRVAAISFVSHIINFMYRDGFNKFITNATTYINSNGEMVKIFEDNLLENSGWILQFFILYALLMFIKVAPKLIGDIFGIDVSNTGNLFEFNPLKKMQEVPLVGAGIGLGAGAIGGLIGGAATGKGFGGKALGALRGAFTGGFKGAQKVPLEGFQPGAKVPFGQTLTPFTAGQTGYKRAEAGNRVAQAKGERRQARATQSESQSNYNRVSNQREHADYGMRENIERRDRFSSMNEQLNPRHDIASQNYNASEQRYNNAVSNASQLNQQLGEVRTRKQNLNENIASLCEQRTQVSEAFERAKSSPDFIDDTRDYQSELDQLTSYINSGAGEINNLNREESQLINDVSVADQEVEQAKTDRDATLADLIDISHEMANNEEEVRDSEETIGYYEQVITDSDNEMAQHQREIEQAQGNIDSAQSRVANAKNERRKVE